MPRFYASMDHWLSARTLQIAAGLGTLCCLLLLPWGALAQLPLEVTGLRGGRHVGSAAPVDPALRLALGVHYAYTEDVLGANDRHHRAASELAAAYTPYQFLQVALGLRARYDAHHGDDGEDGGGAFASEILLRHALSLTERMSLGAQARFAFPAAESIARGFRAVSPELALLFTGLLPKRAEVSLLAGYRFDRTIHAVADPRLLSPADLLAAGISRFDAVLLGTLFACPIGPVTTSLEGSWDVFVGDGAPRATASPMRVRLGAQLPLARRFVPGVEVGVSPSARPSLDRLARIEPRFWAGLSFAVSFARSRTSAPAPTPAPTPPSPSPSALAVRVVDGTGAPIPEAHVSIVPGDPARSLDTDAEGRATVLRSASESGLLVVAHPGFRSHEVELAALLGQDTLVITLDRDLPEGEIKGKVRSLRRSRPLRARIRVEPLGKQIETDEQGGFALAVPPGQYTLRIEAEGHEPQERAARVEHLGVTILVIDLRRAP